MPKKVTNRNTYKQVKLPQIKIGISDWIKNETKCSYRYLTRNVPKHSETCLK